MLSEENIKVLLFDNYGTYIKTYPLFDCKFFQVIDDTIIYCSNDKLISYNTETFEKDELDLPVEDIQNARIEGNKIFIQTDDKVRVYKANNF